MSVKPKKTVRKKSPPSKASSPAILNILQASISIFALAIICLASVSRIFLAAIPMSRDEGTYGLLGKMASKGLTPYVDFYEMKPPMLFYFFGLGGSIFGFNDLGLRLFALLLNLCSSALIFLLLRHYIPKHYALVAAALFSIISLNPFAFGFTMVAEHIVNTLMLTSLYLLHISFKRQGYIYLLLAGVAFSVAILTKQTAILFSPVFLIFFLQERRQRPWLRQSIVFAGGVLIPVVILSILFAIQGAINEAIYWLMEYPAQYASRVFLDEGMKYLKFFGLRISLFQISIFICLGLVFIAGLVWRSKKPMYAILTYLILAILTIFPGFRFYGQYWLLIFVPLALMAGVVLNQLELFKRNWGLVAAILIMIISAGEMIAQRDYYFNSSTPDEATVLYSNNPFGAVRTLAEFAGRQMNENETFMVFGSEPQAYLYAEKDPLTRHIFMSMISKDDVKSKSFMKETMRDLEEKKPTYVMCNNFVYSWGLTENANDQLYQSSYKYIKNHYTPVAAYQMKTNSFLYAGNGQAIDISIPNQIILLRIQ